MKRMLDAPRYRIRSMRSRPGQTKSERLGGQLATKVRVPSESRLCEQRWSVKGRQHGMPRATYPRHFTSPPEQLPSLDAIQAHFDRVP